MRQRHQRWAVIAGTGLLALGGCDWEGPSKGTDKGPPQEEEIVELIPPDTDPPPPTPEASGPKAIDTDPDLKQFVEKTDKRIKEHVIQLAGLRFISESATNIELDNLLDQLESKLALAKKKLAQIKMASPEGVQAVKDELNTLIKEMDQQYPEALDAAQQAQTAIDTKPDQPDTNPPSKTQDAQPTASPSQWENLDDQGLPPGFEDSAPDFDIP